MGSHQGATDTAGIFLVQAIHEIAAHARLDDQSGVSLASSLSQMVSAPNNASIGRRSVAQGNLLLNAAIDPLLADDPGLEFSDQP
jgi:hypothetical protein